MVQKAFGPEQFDLLVIASVILSVGMLGFAVGALCRTRLLHSVQRYETRTTVRHLELQDMAMRDDLTDLPNRRYFYDRLHGELELARNFRRHLAVLVLDIDGFKAINDRYGHKAGDVVLAHVGKRLPETLRDSDVPARIGGDEFAVIMPATNRDAAFIVADRLQRALHETLVVSEDGVQVELRVSLGVSGYPWAGDNADEIVQRADTQMYAVKAMHKRAPA
ncbi:MAG: GGDEF domain-containing protein [Dehalococcoidia bacterium]|nr:MAG: GGDEF domain-containing protein [Dehalococcoidia bacterium]